MTFTQAVASRTKELLKKNQMSQYKLIQESCLTKTTIQTIFKSSKTKDIRLSSIYAIAGAFKMTLSEFFDSPLFNNENIET